MGSVSLDPFSGRIVNGYHPRMTSRLDHLALDKARKPNSGGFILQIQEAISLIWW